MQYIRPTTFADAVSEMAALPEAVPIMGGTDLMVSLNRGWGATGTAGAPPPALLDLTSVDGIFAGWELQDGVLRIGAGLPYTRLIAELGPLCPALVAAARTVGSPQIRNRATVGGNLGTASPAGDTHPVLLASGAVVEVASVRGRRDIPIDDFYLGPKRNALAPDELIRSVRLPTGRGPQQFTKVGTRNAMVIAVCSFAVTLDREARTVGTGLGSAAPTPRRAGAAETLAAQLPWDGGPLDDDVARRFGEAVAAAAEPIDDQRGSAAYRRHALAVLAHRALRWAVADLPPTGQNHGVGRDPDRGVGSDAEAA